MIEKIRAKLLGLHMKGGAGALADAIASARQHNWSILQAFEQILNAELDSRKQSRSERRFKASKLGQRATIDGFDFHFHKSRKDQKALILSLMDLDFISQRSDIIIIGNSGVGKTYLARIIAYAATQYGFRVLFTTAIDMINYLKSAEADHSLLKKLRYYQAPDLLVCDELGYLPLGTQGSELFFQVISARHEKKSTLITTNLPFADWGRIFESTTMATVIADRLVYHSEVLIMEGGSYRQRIKK
jgi:DNA replication protein DnaC